jgi:hypothetical protein
MGRWGDSEKGRAFEALMQSEIVSKIHSIRLVTVGTTLALSVTVSPPLRISPSPRHRVLDRLTEGR